jgi:hypothetical protein
MQRSLGWAVVALGAIWLAVIVVSVSGSDLEFGSEPTTVPIVPLVTWIWGSIATAYVLSAMVQRRRDVADQRHAWVGIAVAMVVIWAVVTVLALILPEFTFEVFDDDIVVPLGALIAPAAGVVVSAIACQYVPSLTDVAYTD